MSSNYLYVDPDGLQRISGPYDDAAENFIRLSGYLSELRGRYANAWGNDDLGQKVSPQVQAALQTLQDQVDALGKALGVYGEGLRTTSHAYREADENADDAATQFRARTERIAVDMPPAVTGEAEAEPRRFMKASTERVPLQARRRALQPGEEVELEAPLMPGLRMRAERVPAEEATPRLLVRGERIPAEEGSEALPLMPALRMRAERIPAEPAHYRAAEPGVPGEPLQPAHYMPAHRVRGELIEPAEPLMPLRREAGTPLIPAEPVLPAQYDSIPAEPLMPLRREAGTPLIPAEPVQPALYLPAEPVEPLPEA